MCSLILMGIVGAVAGAFIFVRHGYFGEWLNATICALLFAMLGGAGLGLAMDRAFPVHEQETYQLAHFDDQRSYVGTRIESDDQISYLVLVYNHDHEPFLKVLPSGITTINENTSLSGMAVMKVTYRHAARGFGVTKTKVVHRELHVPAGSVTH